MDSQDLMLAAGDASGRIQLWHDFPAILRQPPAKGRPGSTTLHWHSNAVMCLAFGPEGNHLLSGGGEGVLVQWQLAGACVFTGFV